MKYTVEIPSSVVRDTFRDLLEQPFIKRGNFFHDVRDAFKKRLANIFEEHGISTFPESSLGYTNYLQNSRTMPGESIIKFTGWNNDIKQELDLEFCAKYGHDDYSLEAINYIDRAYCKLPSFFPFLTVKDFSLGNILLLVRNSDYEIDVVLEKGLRATGYAHQISPRKKKSYFCFFGIHFNNEILKDIAVCDSTCYDLDEIRLGPASYSFYPVIFICRRCGQLFTCSCFDGYFNEKDIERLLPYGNSEPILQAHAKNIKIKNSICSLCTGKVPSFLYGSEMYSSFLQHYLPYHTLFSRKKVGHDVYAGIEHKQIENEVREVFDYPRIGEKWISETILFKIVSTMFSPLEVIHHYRGIELQGLELDVWVPEIQLGIEYQGEQHYQPISHWGGEDGLKKRQENDRKKKALCSQAGYTLVEFHYSEELSEEAIRKRLSQYLPINTSA